MLEDVKPEGIAIVREGHRTLFKWHRARKQAGDLPFTGERIVEGLRLGASVEVDLVRHADDGFAVLHDFALDRDTTGTGRVRDTPAPAIRELFLRDDAGAPTHHRPMLLEDLCALIAADPDISPDSVLQLDLKETEAGLDAAVAAGFAAAVAPVARHFILSGGSPGAIRLLSEAVPALPLGFDPCHEGSIDRLAAHKDFQGFVAEAVAPFPRARMIYLDYRVVLFSSEHGFDLVGAFHAAGKTVDAYTLKLADKATTAIAERLLELQVDQITTDDPVGLERALRGG
ncbi:MAG TPA: glycerophosphodiester phosphodiesterase family protein [Devosia sp.]|nr:glycerophosphodiester phosphodiesterase family protein [Devosia sp.]